MGHRAGHWDYFARDWTAAQAGHTPTGTALAFNPDSNGNGRIEAQEAFDYANGVHHSDDSPTFSESSAAGGDIHLGHDYLIWWWWCFILREILERPCWELPPHEYYERVHLLQPHLRELSLELDKTSDQLRGVFQQRIEQVVREVFPATRWR